MTTHDAAARDELEAAEAELLALQDEDRIRKDRISILERAVGKVKRDRMAEVRAVRRFALRRAEVQALPFGERIYDPTLYLIEVVGVLANGEEMRAAGHRVQGPGAPPHSDGTPLLVDQRFMYNPGTGRIVMVAGGGFLIVGREDRERERLLTELGAAWALRGQDADVTDVIVRLSSWGQRPW